MKLEPSQPLDQIAHLLYVELRAAVTAPLLVVGATLVGIPLGVGEAPPESQSNRAEPGTAHHSIKLMMHRKPLCSAQALS